MTLPGTIVTVRDSAPPRTAPTDTSVWFAAGITEKGPYNEAVAVESLDELIATYGQRVSYGLLYDAVDVFFREGGSRAVIGRVVGPAPVAASHTFQDSVPANSIIVTAKSAGDWGNNLSIAISHPDGTHYQLAISLNSVLVETSPVFATQADAVTWSEISDYVDITLGAGSAIPAAATASLTGGTDDHANATDTQWQNALALFTKDLGPGQVSMPGRTTATAHANLLAHAATNNRFALLDGSDTGVAATLASAAATDRAASDPGYGALFAPWAVVPGAIANTTRIAPYSAVEAGIIARNDEVGLSPNTPAAGLVNGQAQYAIGLSQESWSDADRETLNDAGVNVARIMNGVITTYGYRTLANPATAEIDLDVSNARLVMAIVAQGEAILERYVFAQLDGQGFTLGDVSADLTAMLLPFYTEGSLYGATPADAFNVDTGSTVNPPTTIAQGQLNAQVTIKPSPFAEVVELFITKEAIA